MRSEDYPWLHAITTPPLLTANRRRLAQEGVEPDAAERAVAVVARSLAEEGPMTRDQLRDRVASAGVRTEGQAMVQILMLASLRGLVVRGPIVDGKHAYALVRDWLDRPAEVDRDTALTELARRYLAGHGPASERDLARWAGLPLRDVRTGLSALAGELERGDDGLVGLASRPRAEGPPPPRLLGAFDPILHGWVSREPLLGPNQARIVHGGMFRPFALVGGRGVATWRLAGGELELEPFARLSAEERTLLANDAEDVRRFLGLGVQRSQTS